MVLYWTCGFLLMDTSYICEYIPDNFLVYFIFVKLDSEFFYEKIFSFDIRYWLFKKLMTEIFDIFIWNLRKDA